MTVQELRLTVRRARGHRGRRYEVVATGGDVVGELAAHVVRPNAFEAGSLDLRLTTAGVLAPRHIASRHGSGEAVAVLRHGPLPGRVRVRFPGESSTPITLRGLLRPRLVLPADGDPPALEFRPGGLTGPTGRATLRPSDVWPEERLLIVLALLLHARLRSHTVVA